MGGKWTSFRQMGQETVDLILKESKLEPKWQESQTFKFKFIGSYSRNEALSGLILENEKLFAQYED